MSRVVSAAFSLIVAAGLLSCGERGASLGREGVEFGSSCVWVSRDQLGEEIPVESRGLAIVRARAIVGVDPALAFAYRLEDPVCSGEPERAWHLARALNLTTEEADAILQHVTTDGREVAPP